jgi:hypothetical protein
MSIINPLPYNIQNGQAVDAVPIMANFNQIVNDINANAVAIAGYGSVRPTPTSLGQMFFDATLGQPVWCSSISPVIWVNAAGVQV